MSRHKREEQVQRYFDGELTLPERVAFEASMTEADREQLAALAEMRGLLTATLDTEAEGVDLAGAVMAKLGEGRQLATVTRLEPRPRRRRARWLGSAAGVVLAAAAALVFMLRPVQPPIATDHCDVEDLEVEGSAATVITLDNVIAQGDETTVIWTEED